MKDKLKEIFYLDLRSLALMRIVMGLIILADLILRTTSIPDFYTDQGIMTRRFVLNLSPWASWSLHFLSGNVEYQILLFIIAGIFSIMLIFGYKTKLVTIASFILLYSVQNRPGISYDGGDIVLRVFLFWGMFLPWGARFSVDSIRSHALSKLPNQIFSFGILGYILQICFLYLFAGLFKTGDVWVKTYTAVYYSLNIGQLSTSFGEFLLRYPNALKFTTFFVRWIEILMPIIILFPLKTSYVRLLTVFALITMHISFGATLYLGLFPIIDVAVILGLIPSLFWDKGSRFVKFLCIKFKFLTQINMKIKTFHIKKIDSENKKSDYSIYFSMPLNTIAIFFIIYILVWNVVVTEIGVLRMPGYLTWIGPAVGVNQSWKMFARSPWRGGWWYVVVGTLGDGSKVNLISLEDHISYERPKNLSEYYQEYIFENYLWRMFSFDLYIHRNIYLSNYSNYLCRKWNREVFNEKKLISVEFTTMQEWTPKPDENPIKIKKLTYNHSCIRLGNR